jgi:hypothetical protein
MTNLDLKQHFVDRARALSKEPEIFRCTLLTSLICEAIPFGAAAEAEFFDAAYDDPTGRDYWDAHLSEPMPVPKFANLLAVHLPTGADQLDSARAAVMLALRDAAEAGERWFIGDIRPLLTFGHHDKNLLAAIDAKVRPRAAVDWLLSKPKRRNLVPGSLRNFIEHKAITSTKARSLSWPAARKFTDDFIEKEKKAGRAPTLKGLEEAAKEANLRGGRNYLRDAFRRYPGVEVVRGRPRKIAKE